MTSDPPGEPPTALAPLTGTVSANLVATHIANVMRTVLVSQHGGCGGLFGGCAACRSIYRALVGPQIPLCVLCGEQHFADDRCEAEQ